MLKYKNQGQTLPNGKEIYLFDLYHIFHPDRIIVDLITGDLIKDTGGFDPYRYIRLFDYFDNRQKKHRHLDKIDFSSIQNLSFEQIYKSYTNKYFNQNYKRFIREICNDFQKAVRSSGIVPDVYITIPSRNEFHTSLVVSKILEDFSKSKYKPFFLIFHNYVSSPQLKTVEDMNILNKYPNCYIFERRVRKKTTFGTILRMLSDIVMEYSFRIKLNDPLSITVSADVTGFTKGIFPKIMSTLVRRKRLSICGAYEKLDPQTVSNDELYFSELLIHNNWFTIIEKYTRKHKAFHLSGHGFSTSNCMGIRLKNLCCLGGYMMVNVSEDKLFTYASKEFFGEDSIYILSISDEIKVDARKHAKTYRRKEGKTHYETWLQDANKFRPVIRKYILKESELVELINKKISKLYHSLSIGKLKLLPPEDKSLMISELCRITYRFAIKNKIDLSRLSW